MLARIPVTFAECSYFLIDKNNFNLRKVVGGCRNLTQSGLFPFRFCQWQARKLSRTFVHNYSSYLNSNVVHLFAHYKSSQFHILSIQIKVIILKVDYNYMIPMKVGKKVLLGHGIATANGCFYHDIFAATIVAALALQ
jgi:hypothetical protein